MKNQISEVEAFVQGLKPALITTSDNKKFMDNDFDMLSREYPFLDDDIGLRDDVTSYLFFQTDEALQEFANRKREVDRKSPEYHRLLGFTLGYPPKAVEQFYIKEKLKASNDPRGKAWQEMSVSLYYCGCSVQSHIDFVIEHTNWLWNTYRFEELLYIGVVDNGNGWINLPVGYMDNHCLNQTCEQARLILLRNLESDSA